jgi:hypothetical protein
MEQIFNLDVIKRELDAAEVDTDMMGNEVQRTYLGTVQALYPSGKFYTPWAHGNVEMCSSCEKALELPCDETDPCTPPEGRPDVEYSIVMTDYKDENVKDPCVVKHKSPDDPTVWTPVAVCESLTDAQNYIREQGGAWHCEACKDAQWLEAAAEELDKIEAVLENGDGDPCDLYALRVIETKQ